MLRVLDTGSAVLTDLLRTKPEPLSVIRVPPALGPAVGDMPVMTGGE